MIHLELILKKLRQTDLQIINPRSGAYLTIIRNDKAVDLYDDRIINLVTAEEFKRAGYRSISGALFIIGRPERPIESMETVEFSEQTSPTALLNQIKDILSEHQRFLEYKARLEALAVNATTIRDIFRLFSSYFHNPVAFGDSGGNIIYMENLREDFQDWDETINYWLTLGYVPYEHSKANGNIEMTSMWQTSPTPVLFNQKFASKYPRLSYRTCKYNQIYNNYFSIVQVYEPYRYFDEDVLIITADLVSDKYSKKIIKEIEAPREKAFKLLVSQETSHTDSNADRLKRCHIPMNLTNSLMILDFQKAWLPTNTDKNSSAQKWWYVKNMLNHHQPPILNYLDNDRLILLLQAATFDSLEALEHKLRHILEDDIIIACSCRYDNIWNTHEMYKKALLVLEAGKALYPDSNMYYFRDLFFETFLWLLHSNGALSAFIIGGLAELVEYDRQKNTEFANTLYEYLLCDKNLATLSKKLHIHRNTALYRLEKANEWLKLDLNDYQSTARLFVSYKALDFLERVK
ncbi:MAG: helix-turn-helix domain-containing protein [Clostridium sp.]|nr:helix-turn-helix domain-containing protein [Clostridium sp.]